AALFYLSHPAQDTLPLQMLPWDALYVLFALLCAGFYWRALQREGPEAIRTTAVSFLFFVVALTCKEMAIAIPGFLAVMSLARIVVVGQASGLPGLDFRKAGGPE